MNLEYIPNTPTSFTDIYSLVRLGDPTAVNGTTTIALRVTGSAGATRPFFRLDGIFLPVTITNQTNGAILTYNGVIRHNEYLEIECNSSLSGDIEDLDIVTNVSDYDISRLSINHGGVFSLESGLNQIQVQGGYLGAVIYINFANKFHN